MINTNQPHHILSKSSFPPSLTSSICPSLLAKPYHTLSPTQHAARHSDPTSLPVQSILSRSESEPLTVKAGSPTYSFPPPPSLQKNPPKIEDSRLQIHESKGPLIRERSRESLMHPNPTPTPTPTLTNIFRLLRYWFAKSYIPPPHSSQQKRKSSTLSFLPSVTYYLGVHC